MNTQVIHVSTGIGLDGRESRTYRVPIFNGAEARARWQFMPPHPQLTEADYQTGQLYRFQRVETTCEMHYGHSFIDGTHAVKCLACNAFLARQI